MSGRTYRSKDVLKRAGITYRQLNVWICQGLLPDQPVSVGTGIPRVFSQADLDRCIEIQKTLRRVRSDLIAHGLENFANALQPGLINREEVAS